MELVVRKSIQINAQPAEVWDALTDPDKTRKYFFGAKVISDWKAGGKITFKGRLFFIIKFELSGNILAIEPEKILTYTLKNASDKENWSFSTVNIELSFADGATTITVSDDVGAGKGSARRFARSEKGWKKVLKGLKKLVEH